jgi:two-component system, chemotaxis family, chemotaxis protein CheY
MSPKTILIVDDSISMRKMVAFTLEECGFVIAEAENGAEALKTIAAAKFDLILVDVNMPEMDGITFVRAARALPEYRYTPILILTTESAGEKVQMARQAGATGWIVKPFEPERLLQAVRRVLR